MLVNKKIFNYLKIHTQYSICEGAVKIDELANYCKSNKIKSIGLADSFNLCGALEFSEKISKVGTHPIIGTQINLNMSGVIGKVTLYATSEIGFKNLTKLSSLSYLKNNTKTDPSCNLKDFLENSEDLIILTGNYTNFFGKLFFKNKLKDLEQILISLKNTFKDKLYIEIQRHNEYQEKNFEKYLLKLSKSLQLP